MILDEELKELKKIREHNNLPKNEEKSIPIVKNNNQYKISLPKKFTDLMDMKNKKAKIIFNKSENKIEIEIK